MTLRRNALDISDLLSVTTVIDTSTRYEKINRSNWKEIETEGGGASGTHNLEYY